MEMLIMPGTYGTQKTYGSQKGRPKKKERSAKARTGSFPTGQLKMNMKKMPSCCAEKANASNEEEKKLMAHKGKGSCKGGMKKGGKKYGK